METDFPYEPVCDAAGRQLGVTVIADRAHVRADLRDDAEAAGFRILASCTLAGFAGASLSTLGDLVLVDCVDESAESLALLARLDMCAGKAGTQLVVSTTLGTLDSVFGCFSFSAPQILVDPCHSERVIAIGRSLAHRPDPRLRELGEEDRLMLLRLTEQVGRIAERLERLSPAEREGGGAFRLESPARGWKGKSDKATADKGARPRLPEAAIIRRLIKARQARARFFDAALFADPAWDILLDLSAARAERLKVSVTSLCIAASVPATTALRWIGQLVESGLLMRVSDPHDRRRAYIALADSTADSMARYFAEVGVEDLASV